MSWLANVAAIREPPLQSAQLHTNTLNLFERTQLSHNNSSGESSAAQLLVAVLRLQTHGLTKQSHPIAPFVGQDQARPEIQ